MDMNTCSTLIFSDQRVRKVKRAFFKVWKITLEKEKDEVVRKMLKDNLRTYQSSRMKRLVRETAEECGCEVEEMIESNHYILETPRIALLIRYVEKMFDPITVGR
jgi:hypothetical protein